MTAGGKVVRHTCLHVTSFVYISEVKVRLRRHTGIIRSSVIFVYITWPTETRSQAIFVYMWRHFRSRGHWPRRHVCVHHVTVASLPAVKCMTFYSDVLWPSPQKILWSHTRRWGHNKASFICQGHKYQPQQCSHVWILIQGESLARGPKILSMYWVEKRRFLVRKYWHTGSFKACQTTFRTEFDEKRAPSKCCIQKLVKKLETRGSRSNACRLLPVGLLKGKVYKNTPRTI